MKNPTSIPFLSLAGSLLLTGLTAAQNRTELLERIDQAAAELMERQQIPGLSLAVQHGGDLVVAKGYGWADVENLVPATEHTVYRIGSVTKQFTAAALLELSEQGKVSLDHSIERYFPNYPLNGLKVTVKQLLNHTNGIVGYTEMPTFWEKARLDLSHEEMVELFSAEPFAFEPGEEFQYSNSGYFLAGMIVELASGRSYAEFLEEQFFEPLGLRETYYLSERPIVPGRASGYEVVDGELLNDDMLSMDLPYAAGSLGSSVLDLLRWQSSLVDHSVITSTSFRQMTTPGRLVNGVPIDYGLGVFVNELSGRRRIEHGGGINGFRAQLSYYPDDRLTVAVLTNLGSASPEVLETRLARIVLGLREPFHEMAILSADQLELYAGQYDLGRFVIPITVEGEALMALGQKFLPLGNHRFLSDIDVDRTIEFIVEGGRAVEIKLERLGIDQEGKRVD